MAIELQPDVVVADAHRCAIAGQAQGVTVGAGQAGHLAVGLKLHSAAFTWTADDFPAAAHVGRVQRALEAGTDWCSVRDLDLGAVEKLLWFVFAGDLVQLLAITLQLAGGTAIKIDFPGAGFFAQQLAFDVFKTIGVARLTCSGVDIPFQVRAIGLERFTQGAAFGG